MYEGVRLGIAFTIGLGVGILASKRFFQTKYEKIADEEIQSVREALGARTGHIIEKTSIDHPEEFEEKLSKKDLSSDVKVHSSLDEALYFRQAETVNRYMEMVKAENEHPEEDRTDDIYEITEEDYSETCVSYDKKTLHYYQDDDMLVNAEDSDWTAQDLGSEVIELIRESSNSELYFRDDGSSTDYEVIRIKGAFYIDM